MRRLLHTVKWKSSPIPAGYQVYEYLQSTGDGWVDIPYKVNYKSKIRAKYMQTGTNSIQIVFWVTNGTPSATNAINWFIRMVWNNLYNRIGWGWDVGWTLMNVNETNFPMVRNTWYEIYYNLNVVSMEWYWAATLTPSTWWTSDEDFSLFARKEQNRHSYLFTWRIAYFNIEEDWELTLNLVPVKRLSDDELWYFDTVSQTFYQCYWTFTAW